MIVSYKLLQTYFSEKLPKPEVLAELLTFHAFEIEGMEKRAGDTIIDVKILPNRAHDCLSHFGIAREIATILNIPFTRTPQMKYPTSLKKSQLKLDVLLKDKRVGRYIGIVIDGVVVKESPKWLKDYLTALGQRSINNVVDATNFVMFSLGQPLHAFDYHKVSGGKIVVRPGKEGETMTTLDGKIVTLDKDVMVIADIESPLGVAGIKGGTKAEVSKETQSLIVESANFDASTIRLTAQRLGLKTDASKRFESGLSPYLAEDAMKMVVLLITEIASGPSLSVGRPIDQFPRKPKEVSITVTLHDIEHILGIALSDRIVQGVWKKLGFSYQAKKGSGGETRYHVSVPHLRLDLRLKEDLVEEVGRLVGYHDLSATMPVEPILSPAQNKEWLCRDVVREVMLGAGFSDVYTYTFLGQGEIEVANPIAGDKKYLRNNLMNGLKLAVSENLKHDTEVRIFEFGHIFGNTDGKVKEENSFAALMGFQKRKEVQMRDDFYALKGALESIFYALGISGIHFEEAGGELIASIFVTVTKGKGKCPEEVLLGMMSLHGFELDFAKLVLYANSAFVYKTPSRFPSIIRDVSLFVPLSTKARDVKVVIAAHAGELAQSVALIDVFEQPEQGKKSFAFRLVLQSLERTLSDEDANKVYNNVVTALEKQDSSWQVRK